MKCFSLSAFLTITALSVAGLLSHSAAQQGPSATPPPASPAPGPSATQPPASPAQQGPCQQIMAACQQAGFVQGGAKTGAGLAGRLRPSYRARDSTAAQSFQGLTAG